MCELPPLSSEAISQIVMASASLLALVFAIREIIRMVRNS